MKLSAAICAHPVRREPAEQVQASLSRHVPIIFDENPRPSADPLQRWATHRRAWETAYAADKHAEAVLVLQDDILVAREALAALEEALDLFPRDERGRAQFCVSAYTGTGRPDQKNVRRALALADHRGESWIRTRSLNWGPAICLPRWVVPGMLEAVDAHIHSHTPPYSNTDYAIGVYVRDVLGWATHYTVPSLVEHRGLPSLVGHDKGQRRRAHRYLGGGRSALEVDWGRVPSEGLLVRLSG